jgi:type VI secretion system protein ImpH
MSTARRRKNPALIERLRDEPQAFSFFQAVRLIERAAAHQRPPESGSPSGHPVARFAPPTQEIVRFQTRPTLQFPAGEIESLDLATGSNGKAQWAMTVNFMGLAGCVGVLPFHYTELLLQRLKARDPALVRFLDLFNHRTVSLFFQAACKYRLPVEYERRKLHPMPNVERDPQTLILLSLIGLGTRRLTNALHTRDESLVFYAGLFNQKVRGVSGLRQILRHHFRIPVEIQQFIGQWQELIDDVRSRLAWRNNPRGRNVCLGRSAMLGRHGWYAQGKIRIFLGPLNLEQLRQFAPGTRSLRALSEIVRLYVGVELDYDFVIRVRRRDMPLRIQLRRDKPPVVGWNTWLSGMHTLDCDMDDTLDIRVSARRLQ